MSSRRTMERLRRAAQIAWSYRRAAVIVGAPALLSLLLPYKQHMGLTDKAGSCLFVLLLMACYWTTEAVDITVTALLPLIFFPPLGIMSAESVAKQYLKDASILLIGGFLLAAAIEKCGVQKRIALNLLRLMGSGERTLMLAFMLSTWFTSMWISNTASTAMMITIVRSVLDELEESSHVQEKIAASSNDSASRMNDDPFSTAALTDAAVVPCENGSNDNIVINTSKSDVALVSMSTKAETMNVNSKYKERSSRWLSLSKALSLCVAYSASIGGMATLIGSATNIVLVQNLENLARTHPNVTSVTFASWSVIGLPLSTMLLILCWLWLQTLFFGFRKCSRNRTEAQLLHKFFTEQCKLLGRISFEEIVVVAHLVVLVVLWVTRDMGDAGGWGSLFRGGYIKDGTSAMILGLLLFVMPSTLNAFPCVAPGVDAAGQRSVPAGPILTWKYAQQKIPWGIVLLLGGGFALAEGVTDSGLSSVIGRLLASSLIGLPAWAMAMVMATVTAALTEVASNVAIVTLFLPIVAETAIRIGKNPLYLMFPTCLAASYAFMLPVATPPNAIVFSTGALKVSDMAKAGLIMNVLGICVVTFAITTWGTDYFHLDTWILATNATTSNSSTHLLSSLLANSTAAL